MILFLSAFQQAVLSELRTIARRHGLKAWEIPANIIVSDEPWTTQNGLLTPSGKICRPQLQKRYAGRMVTTTDKRGRFQGDDAVELSAGLQRGLLEFLKAHLPAVCWSAVETKDKLDPKHQSEPMLTETTSLADLGLDSLALASLCRAIEARFGVLLVPAQLVQLPSLAELQSVVLGGKPAGRRGLDWIAEVQQLLLRLLARHDAATAAAVIQDGASAPVIRSETTTVPGGEKVIGEDGVILLTGATGYVGTFTLHNLLLAEEFSGGSVACLVDCTSQVHGLERLQAAYKLYRLHKQYAPWNSVVARITVIAGTLPACPSLMAQLAAMRVRVIVHNAAQVNHVRSYKQLHEVNVQGTADMLLLAASCGALLVHVSTVGCLTGRRPPEVAHLTTHGVDGLSGYAQSKWVAEQLVVSVAERLDLRAMVLRLGLVAGSSHGAINAADTFSKVLTGTALLGIAPVGPDCPLPSRFPLVAVDWCAGAIARLAAGAATASVAPAAGCPVAYHLSARESVSMQTVLQSLRSQGFPAAECSRQAFVTAVAGVNEAHPLFVYRSAIIHQNNHFTTPLDEDLPDTAVAQRVLNCVPPRTTGLMVRRMAAFLQARGVLPVATIDGNSRG